MSAPDASGGHGMSSPDDAPAIRTAGLGKRYGSLWALQDCSVSVPRGRVSALVGPNGAGKSTLLKILAGLSALSAGEAAVLGRAPGQGAEFLDSVGYLAQDVPLYKRLSAGDHLEIGACPFERPQIAAAILARVFQARPRRVVVGDLDLLDRGQIHHADVEVPGAARTGLDVVLDVLGDAGEHELIAGYARPRLHRDLLPFRRALIARVQDNL